MSYTAFFVIDPDSPQGRSLQEKGLVATRLSYMAHQKQFKLAQDKNDSELTGGFIDTNRAFEKYYLAEVGEEPYENK